MTLEMVSVQKIEAAKCQLNTAIKLWFANADQISVHTLACAAYQIIHDINIEKKGAELLLDSSVINKEFRKEYINEMRKAMRFFKHANNDPDPNGIVDFAPAITDLFILFAIIGLERFGEHRSKMTTAFVLFYAINNPHLVAKEFSDRFKVESVANLPAVSKGVFLEQFLQIR